MPLGISRLVLSTSAIRRVFGDVVDGDLEFIITQDGRTLQDQSLRFIDFLVKQEARFNLITQSGDFLLTQSGNTIETS